MLQSKNHVFNRFGGHDLLLVSQSERIYYIEKNPARARGLRIETEHRDDEKHSAIFLGQSCHVWIPEPNFSPKVFRSFQIELL